MGLHETSVVFAECSGNRFDVQYRVGVGIWQSLSRGIVFPNQTATILAGDGWPCISTARHQSPVYDRQFGSNLPITYLYDGFGNPIKIITGTIRTNTYHIDAVTGILHFTNGGNANVVPTHTGAQLASEIMHVLQGNATAFTAEANKLVVYNDFAGGNNTWIFDAAGTTSGHVVELVGVIADAGINAVALDANGAVRVIA